MTKIKSLADLKRIKEEVQLKIKLRENSDNPAQLVQIKVGMATCGLAAGAEDVYHIISEEADRQGLDLMLVATGCIGYCQEEPLVDVYMPGRGHIL